MRMKSSIAITHKPCRILWREQNMIRNHSFTDILNILNGLHDIHQKCYIHSWNAYCMYHFFCQDAAFIHGSSDTRIWWHLLLVEWSGLGIWTYNTCKWLIERNTQFVAKQTAKVSIAESTKEVLPVQRPKEAKSSHVLLESTGKLPQDSSSESLQNIRFLVCFPFHDPVQKCHDGMMGCIRFWFTIHPAWSTNGSDQQIFVRGWMAKTRTYQMHMEQKPPQQVKE